MPRIDFDSLAEKHRPKDRSTWLKWPQWFRDEIDTFIRKFAQGKYPALSRQGAGRVIIDAVVKAGMPDKLGDHAALNLVNARLAELTNGQSPKRD